MKYKLWSPFNIIVSLIISIICLIYFILIQQYLPNSFIVDSLVIKNYLAQSMSLNLGNAFENSAIFFKIIGFNYFTPTFFVNVFSWLVFNLFLFTCLRINKYRYFSLDQIIGIIFFSIVYGFYFTNYSKDLLVILFILIALNLYLFKKHVFIILLFIIFYGVIFRSYWLIDIPVLVYFFYKKKNFILNKRKLALILVFFILFIIIYDLIYHTQLTDTRLISRNASANSLIHNLIPNSSYITDIINYLYILVSLIIPIQGFPSSNMIIYYLWILTILYLGFKYRGTINNRLLLIFICFLSTQALFEPDFGSVFRHQLVFFPILYCIFANKFGLNS